MIRTEPDACELCLLTLGIPSEWAAVAAAGLVGVAALVRARRWVRQSGLGGTSDASKGNRTSDAGGGN